MTRPAFSAGVHPVGAWGPLTRALDPPAVRAALRRYGGVATRQNALDFREHVRRWIKERRYARNSPLTVAVKGFDHPLLEWGDLFANIQVKQVSWDAYFVGVANEARVVLAPGAPRTPLVELANILHEGYLIKFTAAVLGAMMRRLAAADPGLYKQYQRRGGSGILGSTRRVPPRPFIRSPFEDPVFQLRCEARWQRAVQLALGPGTGAADAYFQEV